MEFCECEKYEEDRFVCDSQGEPKGQCAHCGYNWYEHSNDAFPPEELTDIPQLDAIRNYQSIKRIERILGI